MEERVQSELWTLRESVAERTPRNVPGTFSKMFCRECGWIRNLRGIYPDGHRRLTLDSVESGPGLVRPDRSFKNVQKLFPFLVQHDFGDSIVRQQWRCS